MFCLSLKSVLSHCVTLCLSRSLSLSRSISVSVCVVHQTLSTEWLERLIYGVNHAVKGKANSTELGEHAQHWWRTLSWVSHAPSLPPCLPPSLYLSGDKHLGPLLCTKTRWAITIHHGRHIDKAFTSDQALSGPCRSSLTSLTWGYATPRVMWLTWGYATPRLTWLTWGYTTPRLTWLTCPSPQNSHRTTWNPPDHRKPWQGRRKGRLLSSLDTASWEWTFI